jgi:GNAT superfamily N-acetyltransferase
MTIVTVPVVDALPAGFDVLRAEALSDGYRHVERLADDWASGTKRFDASGENLLAAFITGDLAGIGGMTVDPANRCALRMRRFYVRRASRRNGVGRCLAEALMAKARQLGRCVAVNAPTAEAARFWEELGFVRDRRDGHTHMLGQTVV